MTSRVDLDRARRSSSVDMGAVISPSSSSLCPGDSASLQRVESSLSGAEVSRGASLDLALADFSRFMMAALDKVGTEGAGVLVDKYTAFLRGLTQSVGVQPVASSVSSSSSFESSASPEKVGSVVCSNCEKKSVKKSLSLVSRASAALLRQSALGAVSNPGLCYLRFVAKGCRTAAKKCLGVWPTVCSLLSAPAELFDFDLMKSCELVQVSSDMWHVAASGAGSVQCSAFYALASAVSGGGIADFSLGTLGHKLRLSNDGRGAARVVPLSHKLGADDLGEYDVLAPPRDWSWSRQFKWCDAHSYCRLYWKFGVCVSPSCASTHFKVSPARLESSEPMRSGWTKSQRVKWCKNNGRCWRQALYQCDGVGCGAKHVDELLDSDRSVVARAGLVSVAEGVSVRKEPVVSVQDLVRGLSGLSVGSLEDGVTNVGSDAFRVNAIGSASYSPHLVTNIMALDCEMMTADRKLCGTRSVLGRVSVVNYYGQVVFDAFSFPGDCVVQDTNYRWGSGIRPADILPRNGAVPFEVARAVVLDLFSNSAVVGFSITSDFKALRVSQADFPCGVIDVQRSDPFFPERKLQSLKSLSARYLRSAIQVGLSHSSVEDAVATMQLFIFARPVRAVGRQPLPLYGCYLGSSQRVASGDVDGMGFVTDEFVSAHAPHYASVLSVLSV